MAEVTIYVWPERLTTVRRVGPGDPRDPDRFEATCECGWVMRGNGPDMVGYADKHQGFHARNDLEMTIHVRPKPSALGVGKHHG